MLLPTTAMTKTAARGLTAIAILLASGAHGLAQQAADDPVIDYMVVDQRLGDVFAMVERDTGQRIRTTDAVRGRVQRTPLSGPVVPALTSLAAAHNLDLFVFGGTVHVSTKDEATLRLVRLKNVSKDRALAALSKAGLQFAPGDVKPAADGMALTFSGPPRMLAIAEAIVESIPPASPSPAANIRIRRGVTMGYEPVTDSAKQEESS